MKMNEMIYFLRQFPGRLGQYSATTNHNSLSQVAFLRQLQRDMKKQDVLEIPFSQLNVVVFDLETTGFYPNKGDKILSIGAVKVSGDKVEKETYYSLIHNELGVPSQIEILTGITSQDVATAPPLEQVLHQFFQFVKKDPLVAHHANHERNFMQHVLWSTLKTRFEHRVIDTSFLTKINKPNASFVSLDDWCHYYQINIEKRHHALSDALATANLWVQSVRRVQEKGFNSLKDVYSYLATKK